MFVKKTKEISNGYGMLTEFFATYSTFDIFEKQNLYQSFKKTFDENGDRKEYYTSRMIGYYLKENHSSLCDELVSPIERETSKIIFSL